MFDASKGGSRTLVHELTRLPEAASDAERIDRIRAMEEAKNALCAAQAREAAALDASVRAEREQAGVRADKRGVGIGAQVGLARRESPHRGAILLGLGKILATEMPWTRRAMEAGVLSEYRATLLVRETAQLTLEDRQTIDREVAGDLTRLEQLGDRELVAEVQRRAYQLDADSVLRRARRAESDRTVTIRPAPDAMVYLTSLLPMAAGVSAYAALTKQADSLRAAGDARSRGQAMADTVVERLTGRASTAPVPVSVGLVMTDRTLLAGDDEPAELLGHGVVPAGWARDLVTSAAGAGAGAAWFRRLYTAPTTGRLLALDALSRTFPQGLSRWIALRDRATCRTPWCSAPARHADHVVRAADGGPTSAANGQGLCVACNLAKEGLGWTARPRPGPRHTVEIVTPTGHTYRSTAPPMPGTRPRIRVDRAFSEVELELAA
ncbi:DUF222 domain-containing protein [Nocardioides sp. KIGAM211]|uniref:DUF222 domain-containing protein n=1 Tax=Nocardioides luti TaxID=2761101 RepID=A0A7X0RD91_9ACTN|nr:HNH endonuclease signature motif containing protein [Nocardioides luti]MBB6626131.1 DUF222 domain-containing protein [Nocardioides luti]